MAESVRDTVSAATHAAQGKSAELDKEREKNVAANPENTAATRATAAARAAGDKVSEMYHDVMREAKKP
jgi:hypothetical protein